MNEKISIIIPIYNVENYIRKCLDSLINQTYKNIEVLLIDDGSKDNSGLICDEYSRLDHRFIVFHKENGGVSSARNLALKNITGDYLCFVDPDDYVSNKYIENLYNNLKKYDCDISMCYRHIIHENNENGTPNLTSKISIYNENQIRILTSLKSSHSFNMKLFKKHLFDNLEFPLISKGEDTYLMYDILLQKPKIVFDSREDYFYLERNNGLTKTINKSQLNYIDAFEHWVILSEKIFGIDSYEYYDACISLLDSIVHNVSLLNNELNKNEIRNYKKMFNERYKSIKVRNANKKVKYCLFKYFSFVFFKIKGR